jgi:hypothetical protein
LSDFLYCTREQPAGQLTTVLGRFPGLPEAHDFQLSEAWGTLAAVLPQHEREAVFRSDSHTTVVLGSPVVTLPGLAAAPVFIGERRRILHQALGTATFSPDVVDGAFVIAVVDHNDGTVRILTDRFNFIPVFRANDRDGGLVLGTHPDAVAQIAGVAAAVDLVSAADLVANLTCTFPYTLYEGVRQLEPGTVHEFARNRPPRAPRVYWQPREANPFRSLRESAMELRRAVRAAVESSCECVDPVGVLLSGGEDSRAVLAAVPPDTQARAFIYAEWESREVRIARAAAAAYGATLRVGLRAADHYAAGFERTAHLAGSHHLFTDIHGLGLQQPLGLDTMPLVLGGLSADSLLKATYSPRRPPAEFRSPRLPGLREDTLREVDLRRNAFRRRLLELRPDSADEWLQLWPFSMRKHGGNLDGNRRLFRTHEAYHATAVLDVASAVPAEWKRHRRLYHRALRPLFARSKFLPHAEYRFPYYNRLGNALLVPALMIARGARALAAGEMRARHRPWPRWSTVANAPEMRVREELLRQDGCFAHLFEGPARETPARALEWGALNRLMLVQLGQVARDI